MTERTGMREEQTNKITWSNVYSDGTSKINGMEARVVRDANSATLYTTLLVRNGPGTNVIDLTVGDVRNLINLLPEMLTWAYEQGVYQTESQWERYRKRYEDPTTENKESTDE